MYNKDYCLKSSSIINRYVNQIKYTKAGNSSTNQQYLLIQTLKRI